MTAFWYPNIKALQRRHYNIRMTAFPERSGALCTPLHAEAIMEHEAASENRLLLFFFVLFSLKSRWIEDWQFTKTKERCVVTSLEWYSSAEMYRSRRSARCRVAERARRRRTASRRDTVENLTFRGREVLLPVDNVFVSMLLAFKTSVSNTTRKQSMAKNGVLLGSNRSPAVETDFGRNCQVLRAWHFRLDGCQYF